MVHQLETFGPLSGSATSKDMIMSGPYHVWWINGDIFEIYPALAPSRHIEHHGHSGGDQTSTSNFDLENHGFPLNDLQMVVSISVSNCWRLFSDECLDARDRVCGQESHGMTWNNLLIHGDTPRIIMFWLSKGLGLHDCPIASLHN